MLVSRRKPISGGGGVSPTRAINTAIPLLGGGDLSVDRTHTFGPFNNNQFMQGRLTTTTVKNLLGINNSDNIFIGDIGVGGIYLNGAPTVLVFNGSGVGSGLILPSFTNAEELAEPTTEGKVIYNTTLNVIKYWDGTQWVTLGTSSSAVNVTRMVISAKTIRSDSGIAEVHGAAPWIPAEHDISGTRKIYFRAILESEIGGTDVFVKLWNATTQLYVTNLDGLGNAFLKTNVTAPTLLTSHDLNGVGGDNFNEAATGLYEAHYYTSDPNVNVIIHFSEIIVKA
jgi:hypothetical protein